MSIVANAELTEQRAKRNYELASRALIRTSSVGQSLSDLQKEHDVVDAFFCEFRIAERAAVNARRRAAGVHKDKIALSYK